MKIMIIPGKGKDFRNLKFALLISHWGGKLEQFYAVQLKL